MQNDYLGVLRELVAGTWRDPDSGESIKIPIQQIELQQSLDGQEGELIRGLHGDAKYCVVCDEITHDILGSRVAKSIAGDCALLVLQSPRSTMETVEDLRGKTRHAEVLVSVGSGTVNDLVKYASFLDHKPYSAFPTSPMNAYSTGTASLTEAGIKKSIRAHSARGVFFDLQILASCPRRLINNALSDVVCRTTAQVDWRLSHLFFGTPYSDIPYTLLAYDEESLLRNAKRLLDRDIDTLASLVRTCVLNGLGSAVTGTTHPGSMAEHMISHYLDMFSGDRHPGTLHGEQVGVATLSVLRLQNKVLNADAPPVISPTRHTLATLVSQFGEKWGQEFFRGLTVKLFDEKSARKWNKHLADQWDEFTRPLRSVMLPLERIETPLRHAQAHTTAEDLGYSSEFYSQAIHNARFIRDRFTILDLADDSGLLQSME